MFFIWSEVEFEKSFGKFECGYKKRGEITDKSWESAKLERHVWRTSIILPLCFQIVLRKPP